MGILGSRVSRFVFVSFKARAQGLTLRKVVYRGSRRLLGQGLAFKGSVVRASVQLVVWAEA